MMAAPQALDASALAWLDRLLQAPPRERTSTLERLARDDPALHDRVGRLLAASELGDASGVLQPLGVGLSAAAPPVDFAPGATLAGYRLIRELGRGGMAVVWLARRDDGLVRREVALKVPLFTLASALERARFERERDVLASLEHPHIARLYDAGVDASGRPFLVLERVEGEPISAACDHAGLGLRERLRVFLQVLEAVGHAHRHMVVHRDLKPANIFVDAARRVKLLDFGVAGLLGADGAGAGALTREGGCALTPRYGAPEQFELGTITAATDVYALGVILYELLCGSLPHAAALGSVAETVRAVLHDVPLAPSRAAISAEAAAVRGFDGAARLARALAGDLDTIVLKALRKDPAQRYAGVERLADDVRAFLELRPIAARPPSWRHRLRLFGRRHRGALSVAGVGAVGVAVLGVLLGQQALQTLAQRERGDAARAFLLELVGDAEPDQDHPGAEVSAHDILRSGVRRAHEAFAGQPRLLGEVLAELARSLDRLGDDELALATLGESDALLRANAPDDDAARNKVRVQLASNALADDRVDAARALADQVLSACRSADRECAKAHAGADTVLAVIAGRRGQDARGVELSRAAVDAASDGFGAQHPETAMYWERLAVVARNADELVLADRAITQAAAIAGRATLAAQDRAELQRTRAMIDLDVGRYGAARASLQALADGPAQGIEAPRLQRLLANALWAEGDAEGALASATRAVALSAPFATQPEHWFALQAHAMALGLAGQGDAALREMAEVRAGLAQAGYAAGSFEQLRARRLEVELLVRRAPSGPARAALDPLLADLAASGPGAALERAQAIELRGRLQAAAGESALALASHDEARVLLLAALPADHPWLDRNALYRARAAWQAEASAATRAALAQAAQACAARFAATSTWRRVIDDLDAAPAGARVDLL